MCRRLNGEEWCVVDVNARVSGTQWRQFTFQRSNLSTQFINAIDVFAIVVDDDDVVISQH
jgi:hypothetical protein